MLKAGLVAIVAAVLAASLSLNASDWKILSASDTTCGCIGFLSPTNTPDNALALPIPPVDTHQTEINYVYTTHAVPKSVANLTLSVTGRLRYDNWPIFSAYGDPPDCDDSNARVHPFFATTTNIWDSSRNNWWYASFYDSFDLASMRAVGSGYTTTISVPMIGVNWTNLYGQRGDTVPAAWKRAATSVKMLGVTFGCGSFDGHGLAQSGGSAFFDVLSYQVQ